MTTVRFGRAALRDAVRIDAWWRANRPAAPDMFADELGELVKLLGFAPTIGARYAAPTRLPTRRVLLPESQVHLYYRVEQGEDAVTIIRIWATRRGRGPAIR